MQHKQAQSGRKMSETEIAQQTLQLNKDDQITKQEQAGDMSEVKINIFQREFNILEMGQDSPLEMNSSERSAQDIENNETQNMRQDYVQLTIMKEENSNSEQKEEKIADIFNKYICDQILVEWQSQSASNCQTKIQQNEVDCTEGKLEEENTMKDNKQAISQICIVQQNQIPQILVNRQQINPKESNNEQFKQNQPIDKLENINVQIQRKDSATSEQAKNKPMIWLGVFLATLFIMAIIVILWDLETLQSLLRKFIIVAFLSAIGGLFCMEKYMKNKVIQDSSMTTHAK